MTAELTSSMRERLRGDDQGANTVSDKRQSGEIRDLLRLLGSLPGMAYRCRNTSEWPMLFASEGSKTLCGYSPAELIAGQPHWGALIHPEDRQRVWESVQSALRSGERFEIEYRLVTRENGCKWVWEQGGATGSDSQGTVIEGFVADITPLRQKEREKEEQIRRQNERLTATIEFSPIGITAIDKDLRILAANPAFSRMIGYDAEEIIGHRFTEFTYADDIDSTQQAADASFAGGPDHYSIRKRYIHKDGRIVHATLSIAIGHDSEGNPEFAVANIEDLTHQRSVAAQLKERQDQLAHMERLGMLGEMTAGIAHEINQPLTAISTYAHSCLRFMDAENPKPEKLKEALGKLGEQTLRAGAVVERIRELARRRQSKFEIFDCNELIEKVRDLGCTNAHFHRVLLQLRLADDLPAVFCDPIQIQQVVLCLIRNAVDSMESVCFRDGDTVELITDRTETGDVRIAVVDSGAGVNPSVAKNLFRPFSTDKASGIGMSLSISRSIVTACGGQIGYHDNVTAGTTFFLTLPSASGDANEV